MNALELKLPPPILGLLIGAGMWGLSVLTPAFAWHPPYQRKIALLLVLAGSVSTVLGAVTFRRAGTTVSPIRPQATSVLVSTGIYRFSRNPMYLGLSLVLIGWSLVLGNSLSLGGVAVFVMYLNRFQITPEERALTAKFGNEFTAYQRRVRRWL
jgi:protein-S-isoprenylcysteine O-methyltransferase Ste14